MSEFNLLKIKTRKKRVGRGMASGKGKTSGRGMSGQKSRSGAKTKFFEGGQTKLVRRIPKAKGFKSFGEDKTLTLTSDTVNRLFGAEEKVGLKSALEKLGAKARGRKALKIIKKSALRSDIIILPEVKLSRSLSGGANKNG